MIPDNRRNKLDFLNSELSFSEAHFLLDIIKLLALFHLYLNETFFKEPVEIQKLKRQIFQLREHIKANLYENTAIDASYMFGFNIENFTAWCAFQFGFNPITLSIDNALDLYLSMFEITDKYNIRQASTFRRYHILQKKLSKKINDQNNFERKENEIKKIMPDYVDSRILTMLFLLLASNKLPIKTTFIYLLINSLKANRARCLSISESSASLLMEFACNFPDETIANFLLEVVGLNPNELMENNLTPLMMACGESSFAVAQFLLQKSTIDPNISTINGITALHIACCQNNKIITKILLENKKTLLNVKMKGTKWLIPIRMAGTPLVIALGNRNFEIVDLILKSKQFTASDSTETFALIATHYPDKNLQLVHLKLLMEKGGSLIVDVPDVLADVEYENILFLAKRFKLVKIESYIIKQYLPKKS